MEGPRRVEVDLLPAKAGQGFEWREVETDLILQLDALRAEFEDHRVDGATRISVRKRTQPHPGYTQGRSLQRHPGYETTIVSRQGTEWARRAIDLEDRRMEVLLFATKKALGFVTDVATMRAIEMVIASTGRK